MSHPAYIYPAFSHMECDGARAGAAGVRDVCVGPRAICHVRHAFVFITSKAKLNEFKQKNSLSQQTGSTQVRTGAC